MDCSDRYVAGAAVASFRLSTRFIAPTLASSLTRERSRCWRNAVASDTSGGDRTNVRKEPVRDLTSRAVRGDYAPPAKWTGGPAMKAAISAHMPPASRGCLFVIDRVWKNFQLRTEPPRKSGAVESASGPEAGFRLGCTRSAKARLVPGLYRRLLDASLMLVSARPCRSHSFFAIPRPEPRR